MGTRKGYSNEGYVMDEQKQSENAFDTGGQSVQLARWLQQVLAATPVSDADSSLPEDTHTIYHPHFYQQLPDFVWALLTQQPQATLHYAPLLAHLIGCSTCHAAYLDLYAALRAALQSDEGDVVVDQRTGTLEDTPPRLVVHLSQLLIQQAEAILRQARREHTDNSALARSLLQQAIHISTRVTQHSLRSRALQDLVRVATLFEDAGDSLPQGPALHSYSPLLTGGTQQARTVRRAETTLRSAGTSAGRSAIHLQSNMLEGSITQHGDTLELQLYGLDKALRGQYLTISVPLGSLLEPIRWQGGNPRAIRSVVPVDEQGMLSTPLGETALRLSSPEERNLLEATFMLLQVRTAS